MRMRVKAIYRNEVLKPLEKLNLSEGEKVEIEISNAVQRTKGIIKINPELSKEIAESDELSALDA
jgi:predicted DNA-binding antitoxin AbrB/MazE fold protein